MSYRPADARALVAIDLGAESCRVSLLRWLEDGPRVRLVHRFLNGAVEGGDGLRWPFAHIFAEIVRGLELCAGVATEGIRSIAVDGWAVDYVRLDASGGAVEEPYCYRDVRTIEAEQWVHKQISAERMRAMTGIQISRINTAYQLAADGEHLRDLRWLNLPEYVLYRLGARAVAERTNASHSQLLGLDGEWSEEIFAALGLDVSNAPQLVAPGTEVGTIRGPLVSLQAFAQTVLIAPACHDTASAIAGIPDTGVDWAYISSGTWSLVGALLDGPVDHDDAAAANFTNLAAADGKVCFHKGVNGLWLLRQCMLEWSAAGADITVPTLVEAAEQCPAPLHLLDVDDPPLLLPGRMPEKFNEQFAARGLPLLDTSAEGAPGVAALIFHSLAARYAEVLRLASALCARRFTCLYLVGGGSQNRFLNRLTEQASGLRIKGTLTESSTLGNFAIQLATLERSPGDDAARSTSFFAAELAAHHQL